jgi:molybdopterin-containing oxidoreductase family membrane subunit
MKLTFQQVKSTGPRLTGLLAVLGVLLASGAWAFFNMEHHGHIITGMNNHIVWGLPHVFAVFLIVAASGALNVASIGSVFAKTDYKPFAPLSALLALALLLGGLIILLLDLGRPDRMIIAMTHFNFKSIFAWNMFLYTGFMAIVAAYLWTSLVRAGAAWNRPAGFLAFGWRIMLTTCTGSIFGFLVAREAYDSALYAPMFITLSLAYGTAIFLIVLAAVVRATGETVSPAMLSRLRGLLVTFIVTGLWFVAVLYLTNLYMTKHHGVVRFTLLDGGVITAMFWLGQVALGGLLPIALLTLPKVRDSMRATMVAVSPRCTSPSSVARPTRNPCSRVTAKRAVSLMALFTSTGRAHSNCFWASGVSLSPSASSLWVFACSRSRRTACRPSNAACPRSAHESGKFIRQIRLPVVQATHATHGPG